ncbi:MAG: undecaprenyl-phosphate glucose phosphotransferase [Bacteroidota bacterium]|nr:undecaprenyl-phosphate glucose phosphotransferase [Bacteroidota bacterium]MDP4251025.1 undecaprenyl-phosphate glucose phosphotransferase [Bacteroidota bacterium]
MKKSSSFIFFRTLLWLWDIISLNLVLFITSLFITRVDDASGQNPYHFYFAVINLSWMISVYLTALYLSKNWLDFDVFFKRTIKCYFLNAAIIFLFALLYPYPYSHFFTTACLVGFAFVLIMNRIVFNLLVISLRSQFRLAKNVVVLGYNDVSIRLIHYFKNEAKLVRLAGCFDDKGLIEDSDDMRVIRKLEDCMRFVKDNNVTEIYSTLIPEYYPYLYELAREAEKQFVYFKFVPDYQIFVNRIIFVDFLNDIPVLSLRKEPLEDTGNRIKKRTFDVLFSFLVIVFILSWLVPLIALLIKLDSRGPVFFIQLRSGKNNQSFRCIKFRSLRVNDEADSKQVSRDDNRITRLGRFMRKTNIDELPQFFNIFWGDMSLVGPRPHMLKHTKHFAELYKEYMIRHFVKPGLTGWAQVNGFRGEIRDNDFLKKRVEYDIWYIENWSLWFDMKIILQTILVTIKGDENAF